MRISAVENRSPVALTFRRLSLVGKWLFLALLMISSEPGNGAIRLPAAYETEVELAAGDLTIMLLVDSAGAALYSRLPNGENKDFREARERARDRRSFETRLETLLTADVDSFKTDVGKINELTSQVTRVSADVSRLSREAAALGPPGYEYVLLVVSLLVFLGTIVFRLRRARRSRGDHDR